MILFGSAAPPIIRPLRATLDLADDDQQGPVDGVARHGKMHAVRQTLTEWGSRR